MRKILFFLLISFSALSGENEGEYIFRMARCGDCHTDKKNNGKYLAGGRELKTPFGVFYSTNISPDPETGIGSWSEQDFFNALRKGISPKGMHYYPVFPYTSFSGLKDEDIKKMWSYLKKQTPVNQADRKHDLPFLFSFRFPLTLWKYIFFTEGPFKEDPSRDSRWNRGAYLVRSVSHCAECHSPRNFLGALNESKFLSGNKEGAEIDSFSPNITPHKANGIGSWSESDLGSFLKTGMLPDGDFAGDLMADVIDDSLKNMKDSDLSAMISYLNTLSPLEGIKKPQKKKKKSADPWD